MSAMYARDPGERSAGFLRTRRKATGLVNVQVN